MDLFDLSAKITLDSSGYESGLRDAESQTTGFGSKIGSAFSTLGKVTLKGLGAAAAGVSMLVKSAVGSYADYEQLVGGVETLFSSLDGTVSAASEVMANAANAYKTAGMSANEYMETVTSFSAALVSSLEGDYSAAAKVADMAITDMSDNANKMGTSMESIQMAYQGFAKQNYTMLDNLKLGYGGTKQEMERLLADAEKFSGVHYDINNLNDVYEAIHVVQTELGISGISAEEAAEAVRSGAMTEEEALAAMGTTAKEAASTISGSTAMMKASWSNLMTGIADDSADFDALIDNYVSSVGTMADNILPRVSVAIEGVGKLIERLAPKIASEIPPLVTKVLPSLLSAASSLVQSFVTAISANLPVIVESAVPLIMSLIEGLVENLPLLADAAIEIIVALADGISTSLPELIPVIVDVVLQIVNSLIQNAPLLLQAALQIQIALAQGLIAAIPQIVSKAPEIVMALVNAVIASAPMLVSAAGELISTLAGGLASFVGNLLSNGWEMVTTIASGIGEKFSDLVTKGGELVAKVGEGFSNAVSSALSWGKDLIQNFIDGILEKWENLKNTVKDVANSVKDYLGFSEPKLGPLSDFHTYAPDMMDLFMKGIRDNEDKLRNQIETTFDFGDFAVSPTVAGTAYADATSRPEREGVAIYGNINITVEGAGRDAEEIGEDLYNILIRQGVTAYAY